MAECYQAALLEVSNDEILEQERVKKELALELAAIQRQIEESQRQFELKRLQQQKDDELRRLERLKREQEEEERRRQEE